MVRLSSLVLVSVLALSHFLTPGKTSVAQTGLPPGFIAELIVDNLDWPTAFTFAPDGRIFIAEKAGRVKVWKDGVLHARPVIDIREEVNNFVDRGLIGIALDPSFTENGWIYLMYAWDAPGEAKDVGEVRRSRLVRYTLDGNIVRPGSERVLFDDHFNYTLNHSVGTLKFDREGNLWASLGDGSLSALPDRIALTAQSLDTLQGKIIRIDPRTGAGVPGNPFFDPQDPKSARSRVWSYGYRNPFRFALHPETQLPYVGDVGWDTYEMLMIATPGSNFGWPCVEGINDLPEFQKMPECRGITAKTTTPKELSYAHAGANASVTAGDFNTGDNFPAEMRGDFFWGDYSTQKLWRTTLDEQGRFKQSIVFAEGAGEPVDMQFGPDGALWYLSIYSRGLMRIRYADNPLKPLARISETKPLPGPRATVLSPADGETFLGGQFVRLRGAVQNAARSYWYVVRYDSARATLLHSAEGTGTTFLMPRNLGDESFVEATFAAVDDQGRTASQKVNLYAPHSDGYIRSWWLIGGYPWRTLDDDPIGEATYVPSFSDPRAWTVRSRSHNIDLIYFVTPNHQDTVIAYAFVWIVSPEDRKGLLGMNSDDGIAAWLNGQRIWYNRINRGMPDDKRDIDLPPIELKKGYNALLLKIENVNRGGDPRLQGDWRSTGGWQFKARVLNPDGSIMRDVVPKLVRP